MPPESQPAFADVSVIIPAYRAAKTIKRALISVAAQTLKPREVIVVDDGSDDGTAEVAAAYRERMNGIALKIVRQENAGAGKARNRAIVESTGRILAFLDSDDEWLPEKIERCLQTMEEGGHTFVCHNVTLVAPDGSRRLLDCRGSFERTRDPYLSCFLWGFVSTPSVVVARESVIAAGGFDPTLPSGQDFELWLAIFALAGTRVCVLAEPLTDYHSTPGGITSQTEIWRRCALRIVRDHAKELRARVALPAWVLFLRTLVIEYVVLRGHLARGSHLRAIGEILRAPVSALAMVFSGRVGSPRGNFLAPSSAGPSVGNPAR